MAEPEQRGCETSCGLGALVGLFLVALGGRAGVGLYLLWSSGFSNALQFPDEQQYWLIASSHWRGEGLRDELGFAAGRMPLYPMLLAPFTAFQDGVLWSKVVHWLMGALAAPLAAILGAKSLGVRGGIIAGIIVAIDPFLTYSSSLLLTETFFLVALLALWIKVHSAISGGRAESEAAASKHGWMAVGLLGALCIYLRESCIGLVFAALCLFVMTHCTKRSFRHALLTGGGIVLLLIPWAMRNYQVTGRLYWLTTRGGISLYDGVHAGADGSSDLGDIKDMPAVRHLSETQRDDFFRAESWREIRRDPTRIVRLGGVKLARMWNPIPNVGTHRSLWMRILSGSWTIPLFLLTIVGVVSWRRGKQITPRSELVLIMLPLVYFSLLHSLFVGSVRYRLPLTPFIAILAAHGLAVILGLRRDAPTTALAED